MALQLALQAHSSHLQSCARLLFFDFLGDDGIWRKARLGHRDGCARLRVDDGHDPHHLLDELAVERELERERPVALRGHPRGQLLAEVVEVERAEEVV